MTNRQKLNRLCKIRTDLGDDNGQISSINSSIGDVAYDFARFVISPYSNGIRARIEALREPYQSSDHLIQTAKSYCQYEINRVYNEINNED